MPRAAGTRGAGRTRASLRDDRGFAMVTVIGTMLVMMLVAFSALAVVTREIKPSRHAQDYQAAVAAAQAGVDDYLSRLATCDTYWRAACAGSPTDNALVTAANPNAWQQVPATSGSIPEYYQYQVVTQPSNGLLRIRSTGRVNGVKRTLTADLRKQRLLSYIYFTDYETLAPALYPLVYPAGQVAGSDGTTRWVFTTGVTAANAQRCTVYHYNGRGNVLIDTRVVKAQTKDSNGNWVDTGATGTTYDTCDDIQFGGGDTLAGRLHTNDSLLIGSSMTFKSLRTGDKVGTSWPPSAPTQPPNASNLWWGGGSPTSSSMLPTYEQPLTLPASNRALVSYADKAQGGQGCYYTGPTQLTFNADGTLSVTSPNSADPARLNPECGSASSLAAGLTVTATPRNGVIYVDNATGTCSSTTLPFVRTSAETACTGDAFVSGTVSGRFTVGTANDLNVVGNTVYNSGTASSSVDSLGLIGNGFVQVYHPVTVSDTGTSTDAYPPYTLPGGGNGIEIDAAMLSVQGSITVQNYTMGGAQGTLRVFGTLAQEFRGPVGTNSGATGYVKNYTYDPRLLTQPPPFFLDPTSAQWQVQALGEQANP